MNLKKVFSIFLITFVFVSNPSAVHLHIFSIVGAEIYSTTILGTAGENRINWQTTNSQGSKVGSGLYIYVVDIADGSNDQIYHGKVVVIN